MRYVRIMAHIDFRAIVWFGVVSIVSGLLFSAFCRGLAGDVNWLEWKE